MIMLLSVILFTFIAAMLSTIMVSGIIKLCKIYSLYDSINARKIHSGNIPRLGGVAISFSFIIITVLFFFLDKNLSFFNAFPLLAAGMLIFIFGILDDVVELRAIFKLLVQLVACGIVVAGGFRFRQIFGLIIPDTLSSLITFCWILGLINAYNLIDGLDGLCGILSATTLFTMGIIIHGSYKEGAAICMILVGSIIGFLVWNWPAPNAKIFMGDNGSQFLGFMIATVPLYVSGEEFEFNKFLMMLVLVSFPMLDTIAAIWRRIREHRSIMSPDRCHLHHKLLNLGFDKHQALYMVLGIQDVICLMVWLSTLFDKEITFIILIIAYIFVIVFFVVIHFTNRAVLRKIASENEQRNSGEIPKL